MNVFKTIYSRCSLDLSAPIDQHRLFIKTEAVLHGDWRLFATMWRVAMAINLLSAFGCIVFSLKQGGCGTRLTFFVCGRGCSWELVLHVFYFHMGKSLDANSWLRLQNFPLVNHSWNSKQPVFNGCLEVSNHFPCKDVVHHPIEPFPFCKWMFLMKL